MIGHILASVVLTAAPPNTYRLQIGEIVIECAQEQRGELAPAPWECAAVPWAERHPEAAKPAPEAVKPAPVAARNVRAKPARRIRKRRRAAPVARAPAKAPGPRPTLLRRKAAASPELDLARAAYAAMLDGKRRGLRTSPLAVEAVRQIEDAEAVAENPSVFIGDRPAAATLLDGRPRRRTAIYRPTDACLETLEAGARSAAPPSLECLKDTIRYRRYEKDDAVGVASVLYFLTGFPLFENVKELRAQAIKMEALSPTLWALGWLRWVGQDSSRLDPALATLTGPERRTLRRALSRWWLRAGYAAHQALITRIFETRFIALCPGCRGAEGLPRRSCFRSEYLYRTNLEAALAQR